MSLARVTSIIDGRKPDEISCGTAYTVRPAGGGYVQVSEVLVYNGLDLEVYPGELVRYERDADGCLMVREIVRPPGAQETAPGR